MGSDYPSAHEEQGKGNKGGKPVTTTTAAHHVENNNGQNKDNKGGKPMTTTAAAHQGQGEQHSQGNDKGSKPMTTTTAAAHHEENNNNNGHKQQEKATSSTWAQWAQTTPAAHNKVANKVEKPTASATSASRKAAFSAPAAKLEVKLGSAPSTTCSWDFILSCGQQAHEQGDSCMKPMAETSDNCFSDSTCAGKIGSDAPTCAVCFSTMGKPEFVKAVYQEKDDSNVAPIFESMVSYGVCSESGEVVSK